MISKERPTAAVQAVNKGQIFADGGIRLKSFMKLLSIQTFCNVIIPFVLMLTVALLF